MFTPPPDRVKSGRVSFMATCLCDAVFDDAAKNAVAVLEKFAGKVDFPQDQTCCGQPAFNSGDFESARRVIRSTLRAFADGDGPIVLPSSSCAAMLYHSAKIAFRNESREQRDLVDALARRTWELCDFLVNALGVEKIGGQLSAKIALHDSCHSRGSGTPEAARRLLSSIEGVSLADFERADECCGFGGTFSVSFPEMSSELGLAKVNAIAKTRPDFVVSADTSCLLHQGGIAKKSGINYRTKHVAQIFHAAMKNGGLL